MTAVGNVARDLYRGRYGYAFIAPTYILFLGLVFLPVIGALALAFFQTNFVSYTWVGLNNFLDVASTPSFRAAIVNTVFYVAVGVPVTLAISLAIAVLVRPLPSRLQTFFRGAFYLPGVAGGVILSLVWIWIFNPAFGLLNWLLGLVGVQPVLWLASASTARWAVLVVLFSYTIGQPIILFLAGLESLPPEVEEAARVDGAGAFRTFWSVTLPLLRPVAIFVVTTMTIGIFQIWETVYLTTGGGPNNASTSIVYEIYKAAFLNSDYGRASAMAALMMLAVMPLAFAQLRLWGESYLE